MVKVGVVGALGYAGKQLVDILLKHPSVQITALADKMAGVSKNISEVFGEFKGKIDLECKDIDIDEVSQSAQIIFLALPHRVSQGFVAKFYKKGNKIIDLSADFRLQDIKVYEQWYETRHLEPLLVKKAVYGLPELYKAKIKNAKIVANPGCYPTSIILGCAPLLADKTVEVKLIIADSKSGYSGAGRQFVLNDQTKVNFKAYGVGIHRHTPEIEQELSKLANKKITVSFTPHLIPVERGIISTIYLPLKKDISAEEMVAKFKKFYKGQPFVRILPVGQLPETKNVIFTNYCDIGVVVNKRTKQIIIVTGIDNLVKGAAGQAVQNMNLMCGFEETAGLV
ncbi:MAG: N-acetyl-gamma-glutamyl-phosphate reductase [bacterium]